jgi:hypothetical protein
MKKNDTIKPVNTQNGKGDRARHSHDDHYRSEFDRIFKKSDDKNSEINEQKNTPDRVV